MPKLGINYCIDIMQELKIQGFTEQVGISDLRRAIMRRAGSMDRTILRYVELLQVFGFMTPVGSGVMKLNWDEVDKYIVS